MKNCFNGRLRARAAAAARQARLEGRPYGREAPERKCAAAAGAAREGGGGGGKRQRAGSPYAAAVSPSALLERCPERLSPFDDGEEAHFEHDSDGFSDSEASAASALESLSRGGSFLFSGSGTSSPSSSVGGGGASAFAPTPRRRYALSQQAVRRRLLLQQQQVAGGAPSSATASASAAASPPPGSPAHLPATQMQQQMQHTQRLFAAAAGPPPASWSSEASLRDAWEAAMSTAAAAVAAVAAGAGGGSGSSPGSPLAASASASAASASASASHLLDPGSSSSPSSPSAAFAAAAAAPAFALPEAAAGPAGPSRFAPASQLKQQQQPQARGGGFRLPAGLAPLRKRRSGRERLRRGLSCRAAAAALLADEAGGGDSGGGGGDKRKSRNCRRRCLSGALPRLGARCRGLLAICRLKKRQKTISRKKSKIQQYCLSPLRLHVCLIKNIKIIYPPKSRNV